MPKDLAFKNFQLILTTFSLSYHYHLLIFIILNCLLSDFNVTLNECFIRGRHM